MTAVQKTNQPEPLAAAAAPKAGEAAPKVGEAKTEAQKADAQKAVSIILRGVNAMCQQFGKLWSSRRPRCTRAACGTHT